MNAKLPRPDRPASLLPRPLNADAEYEPVVTENDYPAAAAAASSSYLASPSAADASEDVVQLGPWLDGFSLGESSGSKGRQRESFVKRDVKPKVKDSTIADVLLAEVSVSSPSSSSKQQGRIRPVSISDPSVGGKDWSNELDLKAATTWLTSEVKWKALVDPVDLRSSGAMIDTKWNSKHISLYLLTPPPSLNNYPQLLISDKS